MDELTLNFTRQALAPGDKEKVWLRIQNHIRQQRLQSPIAFSAVSKLWPKFYMGKITAATLAAVLAIIVIGGATKASEGSLPGDTLYSVKKVAEKVEKVLATSDEAKVKVGIKHAKRRLKEVQNLVAEKKESEIVTKALEELQITTEQVISAAAAAEPELRDNAASLVAEETTVLNGVKEQVEEAVKQVVQTVISASHESISKLQGSEQKTSEVQGRAVENDTAATSTPASPSPAKPRKPKIQDGKIESNIQIESVIKLTDPEGASQSGEPQVLSEPSAGF